MGCGLSITFMRGAWDRLNVPCIFRSESSILVILTIPRLFQTSMSLLEDELEVENWIIRKTNLLFDVCEVCSFAPENNGCKIASCTMWCFDHAVTLCGRELLSHKILDTRSVAVCFVDIPAFAGLPIFGVCRCSRLDVVHAHKVGMCLVLTAPLALQYSVIEIIVFRNEVPVTHIDFSRCSSMEIHGTTRVQCTFLESLSFTTVMAFISSSI